MSLNRRHKAILFITVVFTGCGLLLGADLKDALGFCMLGAAFAWAVGSDSATKLYVALKGASGRFYSLMRLPLAMGLAGGLLGAALLFSHAHPVLAVASMCAAGIAVTPFSSLPSKSIWLRIPLILLAGIAFIAAAGVVIITATAESNQQYGERFGQLVVTGFIALLTGLFWLSKGWRLVVQGITPSPPPESPGTTKRVLGHYISLAFGLAVLTLWLSLLAWLSSSAWAYAPDKAVSTKDNNLLIEGGFVLLLASWPYAAWRRILSREPNSEPKFLCRHRRVSAVAGMLFVIFQSLAVTYGIQNGDDQRMVEKMTAVAKDLTTAGTKIGSIKQRDLRTTDDYIQAYAEIESLLPEFESEIQRCTDVYQQARQMDEDRGPINTRFFYKSHTPDMWRNNFEMLDLLRQVDSLTRQEVSIIHDMAALPEHEQVAFWNKEFQPLLVQEDQLRGRIQVLAKKTQATQN